MIDGNAKRCCEWRECGKDIAHMGPKAKYCRESCKKRKYRSEISYICIRKCTICKKTVNASGKFHRKRICSHDCWKKWDSIKHARRNDRPLSLIGPLRPKDCLICSKPFVTFNGRDGYCSTKCKSKARSLSDAGVAYRTAFANTGYYLEWSRNRAAQSAISAILLPSQSHPKG
jgi:hypothetical protein